MKGKMENSQKDIRPFPPKINKLNESYYEREKAYSLQAPANGNNYDFS